MGFILDGLETQAYDRTYNDRELLRRIISYFRPHRRQMAVVGVSITLFACRRHGWADSDL